jgi:hypothetical protein
VRCNQTAQAGVLIVTKNQPIMNKFTSLSIMLLASLAVLFTACNSDERTGNARLQVYLTDAPGDYEEVNVEIIGVQVNRGDNDSGWESLAGVQAGVYNLLDFTNGIDTLIAEAELPSGRINQVRLLLGNNNSLKIHGETHSLTTPSGQQSGLKLSVNFDLTPGVTYRLLLDFDAAKSIVPRAGGYNLKPVIRVITQATSGAIRGTISPAEANAAVMAMVGADTVGTSYANEDGFFLIRGLDAGTYTLMISSEENYTDASVEDVEVVVGSVTDVGVIELIPLTEEDDEEDSGGE